MCLAISISLGKKKYDLHVDGYYMEKLHEFFWIHVIEINWLRWAWAYKKSDAEWHTYGMYV